MPDQERFLFLIELHRLPPPLRRYRFCGVYTLSAKAR
jgi:hypothetical protein